jgi:hypothetical protein
VILDVVGMMENAADFNMKEGLSLDHLMDQNLLQQDADHRSAEFHIISHKRLRH